ncbi:MAG: hypothetical protein FJY81_02230 [Candidatus Aminicenantes bacterium]|nr:hypothetical protein [Candidatus Aminicenantes bacterium]
MAGLKTYALSSRKSKVSVKDFAGDYRPGKNFREFITSLPDILAGRDFKEFVVRLQRAREKSQPILWGLGAHVIKVGLNPVLIRLMKKGWASGLAFNGAGTIHDFEIAFCGRTSEDVAAGIRDGKFGMARETGQWLNQAINRGAERGVGLGRAVGEMIFFSNFPYKHLSLLAVSHECGIPATVHVALGTDVIHFHPEARGEALGKTSLADFFLFCSLVEKLESGGVFINIGSAVVLPEVFLKAVSYVRNKGLKLDNLTAAVFDFIHHYRPSQNIAGRVLGNRGKGFYFIGHHEIMIPLLAASLLA